MAQWIVEIEVTNLPAKRVRVTATRTDGDDIWKHTVNSIVNTDDLPGTRDMINGVIWDAWIEYQEEQAQIETLLTGYEVALAADLNTREGV